MRSAQFKTNAYYHVFNRGVDKRIVFPTRSHYLRFITTMRLLMDTGSATKRSVYNQGLALKYKVTLLCYCLMPNHYHMLIQQTKDGGITEFMHKLDTSYTMYFNKNQQHKRSGRLFEYVFKAKHIDSEEQLLHVTRYIHLNPLIGGVTQKLETYPWSSYIDYLSLRKGTLCEKSNILSFFQNSPSAYQTFVNDQTAYAKILHTLQHTEDENTVFL